MMVNQLYEKDVQAMQDHARLVGITELLLDCRREHQAIRLALESNRERIAQALVLLGAAAPPASPTLIVYSGTGRRREDLQAAAAARSQAQHRRFHSGPVPTTGPIL